MVLGGGGIPLGWAGISWMGTGRKENPTVRAMLKAVKAGNEGGKRVKGVSSGPLDGMTAALETGLHEESTVSCSALICRKCLSERLDFARFSSRSF
jgi:hypothetical protein